MFGLGPQEMVIVLILGVLLFGKRLPEVGRSLGKGLVEFKKGMRGLEDDLDTTWRNPSSSSRPSTVAEPPPAAADPIAAHVPKFSPPSAAPAPVPPAGDGPFAYTD